MPPVGEPYGLASVVEDELSGQPEVYFEAGDHEHLIRLTQAEFMRLMSSATMTHFSRRL